MVCVCMYYGMELGQDCIYGMAWHGDAKTIIHTGAGMDWNELDWPGKWHDLTRYVSTIPYDRLAATMIYYYSFLYGIFLLHR